MQGGFDAVSDLLNHPMFVVTTAVDGERAGCLVGFATQASIDPPRFLVGLSDKNRTYRLARGAERLVVHVLGSDGFPTAELFGSQSGDDIDKFEKCRWRPGPDGVPVLDDAVAWFSGKVLERVRTGDHVGFLIEVDAAEVRRRPDRLLTVRDVRDLDPGHDA